MRPSFLTSVLSVIIYLFAFLYFLIVKHNIKDDHNHIIILFLLSIVIGLHSLHHYFEEIYYNYNPLKTFTIIPSDEVQRKIIE